MVQTQADYNDAIQDARGEHDLVRRGGVDQRDGGARQR
jgi:hypothetical protein